MVTPRDVDARVRRLSSLISAGINAAPPFRTGAMTKLHNLSIYEGWGYVKAILHVQRMCTGLWNCGKTCGDCAKLHVIHRTAAFA